MLLESLAAAFIASSPTTYVDPEVRELEMCRVRTLGFRNANEGWLGDQCGRLFVSRDGGRSWARDEELETKLFGVRVEDSFGSLRGEVQHVEWLGPDTGLFFLFPDLALQRTEDGGKTWTRIELPRMATAGPNPITGAPVAEIFSRTEMVYSVESFGERVWFCGSSGTLSRSFDRGRTWTRGPALWERAGIHPQDWCAAISFVDEDDGWATGWASLWKTRDGGQTWQASQPILPPAPPVGRPIDFLRVVGLVRLDREVAWARTEPDQYYRTTNGGRSWTRQGTVDLRPEVRVRRDGRALIVRGPSASADRVDLQPLTNDEWVPVGRDAVINVELDLFVRGERVRSGPATTPPSGKRAALQGQVTGGRSTYGWAGERVFASDDERRSWRMTGTLPAPVRRLVAMNAHTLLAMAGERLFLSEDAGRAWEERKDAATRGDWARLSGEPSGLGPTESIDCALRGPARLTLSFGVTGCFGGSESSLSLEIEREGTATLRGELDTGGEKKQRMRRLTPAETQSVVKRLHAAAIRTEVPSACHSTNTTHAYVVWSCDGAPSSDARFRASDCGNRAHITGAQTTSGWMGPDDYARALGLAELGEDLLLE